MRNKLQEFSKSSFTSTIKDYINFDSKVTDLKIRKGIFWKKDETSNSTLEKFGFCSARQMALCKNYNDTIVRLIEFNMYKLIDTTYKFREQLDINNKHITDQTSITKFLNAVFCKPIKLISNEEKIGFEKTFKTDFKKKLQESKTHIPDSKQQIIVVSICFDFLIELNRLICELNYAGFIGLSKARNNILSNTVSKVVGASIAFFGTPKETYNILMREYTMMTANFGMMSTRYTLDYNKLTNAQKETVSKEVDTVLAKVNNSMEVIANDLHDTADKTITISKQLGDGESDETLIDPPKTTLETGGRKRSKKYKSSKKLKSRRKQYLF